MLRLGPWALALLVLLLPGMRDGAAEPAAFAVTARALDRPATTGRLVGLDAGGVRIRPDGGEALTTVPLEAMQSLTFSGTAAAPVAARRYRAHLTGGDVLVGRLAGGSGETIHLVVAELGEVKLAFEGIRTLEFVLAEAGPCSDLADKHPRVGSGDIAYDTRDDEYTGTATEANAEGIVIASARGRERTVPWEKLRVLHLENEAPPPAEGVQAEVELVAGSRIAVEGPVTQEDGALRFASRTRPGTPWTVPPGAVRAVRWWGGRFVYASMLPFRSEHKTYHGTPDGLMPTEYLDRFFGARVDRRRVSGCPLQIDGVVYRRGFGVNSHSTIELPLDGAYRRFRAGFGIDDEALDPNGGGRGEVDARVLADGKVLWETKGVKGGEAVRSVGPLDVTGVKTLVLEVGFGEGPTLHAWDRADWVDPLLERK